MFSASLLSQIDLRAPVSIETAANALKRLMMVQDAKNALLELCVYLMSYLPETC